MAYPESMVALIEAFSRLPGVGIRTAERFALYCLSMSKTEALVLSDLIKRVNESIHTCQQCYNLSQNSICHICADSSRDHSVLCVVSDPKDVIAIEKSGDYRGVYHVLGGSLSPLEGIGPKDLKIKELIDRIRTGAFKELIIATTSDTEGDATSLYLVKHIKSAELKVTRIAHGVPVGSALEFVDKATLSRALKNRHEV